MKQNYMEIKMNLRARRPDSEDKTILISAYSCDPDGVSESLAAFNYLKILIKNYNIILLTTHANKQQILNFYKGRCITNLEVISFPDKYPFRQSKLIHESLKIGYFIFNWRIYRYLKKHSRLIERSDILYHKSPSGFRYYSLLYKFNKPYIFGPTGGGLHPPKELKEFFKKEHSIFKLRKLDQYILKLPVYKKQFNAAKKILVTLPYVRHILGNAYCQKYSELLDTGIDTKIHRPIPDMQKRHPLSIIYVGKLTRYKGAELLIRSVLKIRTSVPFIVDIYGDGEDREYLETLVESLSLSRNVTLHGYVNRAVIPEIYTKASIFCFPTITEASGNALLEAMSYSLPIITVNNGGPQYMCPNEGTFKIAISTPETMIENIARALKILIEDKKKRIQMGRVNRQHCIDNFDWTVIENNLLSFFKEALKS